MDVFFRKSEDGLLRSLRRPVNMEDLRVIKDLLSIPGNNLRHRRYTPPALPTGKFPSATEATRYTFSPLGEGYTHM